MWEQMSFKMAFIKIACLPLIFLSALACTSWEGNVLHRARWSAGPDTFSRSPCHYQHLERVNKPQVSRHTAGRQSVHPAASSCRPRCVQVTALPPPASFHLRSLASCFSSSRIVTEQLLFLLILWMCSDVSCLKTPAVNIVTNKVAKCFPSTPDPLLLVKTVAVISKRGDVVCLHWHTVRAINTLHK